MNVIMIGCGQIARTHIAALSRLGHCVTWVVGRSLQKTEAFAKECGIPNFTVRLSEALASDAKSVHVCTPPTNHFESVRESLLAGKHVICEKPLTLSEKEAEQLATLQKESGLIGALCCNVRFYPSNQEAARRVRAGEIGRPLILSGSYLQEFHAPPHPDGWRFDPKYSGDQRAISEIGTHWIDLAYAWTGTRVKAVSAALGNWYPVRYRSNGMLSLEPSGTPVRVETEDAAAITMRFENGEIGALMLSEVSRGHFNDLTLELSGSDGTIRWEEADPGALTVFEDGCMRKKEFGDTPREETFLRLFREVYAAIAKEEHAPFPTFDDGVYLAKVCAAIRKSGISGTWVEI